MTVQRPVAAFAQPVASAASQAAPPHSASPALPPPNMRPDLLQSLLETFDQYNLRAQHEPGEPRIEIARDLVQLRAAATLMTQAFVRQRDKGWLAWLRPAQVQRIHAGDAASAERQLTRVMLYLLRAATFSGGITILETARDPADPQRRIVRGAGMSEFPVASDTGESVFHKYCFGAWAALRSYGLLRALAADRAYRALAAATEQMRQREGIDAQRCVRAGMLCVHPDYEGTGIAHRVFVMFQGFTDRHGLYCLMQSSNPERNDERVFKHWGFRHVGEYCYGASRFNSVGAYAIKLLVRPPGGGH